jgi:hypothetical protein
MLLAILCSTARAQEALKIVKDVKPAFPAEADDFIYGDRIKVIIQLNDDGTVKHAIPYGPFLPCSNLQDKTANEIADAAVEAANATIFEPRKGTFMITYTLPTKTRLARDADPAKPNNKAVHLAKPVYLTEAKEKNIQGEAKLDVLIDESGKVVSVGPNSGHGLLIAGSIRAACESRFTPPPAKYIGVITYRFVR